MAMTDDEVKAALDALADGEPIDEEFYEPLFNALKNGKFGHPMKMLVNGSTYVDPSAMCLFNEPVMRVGRALDGLGINDFDEFRETYYYTEMYLSASNKWYVVKVVELYEFGQDSDEGLRIRFCETPVPTAQADFVYDEFYFGDQED